jgi:hypothetical protein
VAECDAVVLDGERAVHSGCGDERRCWREPRFCATEQLVDAGIDARVNGAGTQREHVDGSGQDCRFAAGCAFVHAVEAGRVGEVEPVAVAAQDPNRSRRVVEQHGAPDVSR